MIPQITIIKRNASGKEVWHYTGTILKQQADKVVIEAYFLSPEQPFMGTILRTGDRFIETYYLDRWYNIFEIHDKDDDHLKGWYCNITRPARFESEGCLAYEDLALDLWVKPDGAQAVLDEDEFAELELDIETQAHALAAMEELKAKFRKDQKPGM
jgi:predicted RNA-binding protein associated with RNAse of E/G family